MPRQRRKRMAEINVVPYIDVMLVLLVIFMITAPMLTQGVKVDLPRADAEPVEGQSDAPLVVAVDARGAYHLEHDTSISRDLDAEQLSVRVAAILRLKPKTPVYVKGDERVGYGKVVYAMVLLQKAGASSVGLLTESDD
ncbi:protein TolR [Thiohalomonas denitrificans]|uniref:protein TolR n=1 Tax=Thiohalomonas denitrificans TaxID=415747 RepID=UPI0026EC1E37|nr:protein TolR [Thiohalomonas denitrificans]